MVALPFFERPILNRLEILRLDGVADHAGGAGEGVVDFFLHHGFNGLAHAGDEPLARVAEHAPYDVAGEVLVGAPRAGGLAVLGFEVVE